MSAKSLLLVEEDQRRRLSLGNAILRRRWRLRTARDPSEALAVVDRFKPAVIVLDLDCVRGAPDEVVERLREYTVVTDATIIGTSARERDAEALGIDACMLRPFSPDALFTTIEDASKRRADRAAAGD